MQYRRLALPIQGMKIFEVTTNCDGDYPQEVPTRNVHGVQFIYAVFISLILSQCYSREQQKGFPIAAPEIRHSLQFCPPARGLQGFAPGNFIFQRKQSYVIVVVQLHVLPLVRLEMMVTMSMNFLMKKIMEVKETCCLTV